MVERYRSRKSVHGGNVSFVTPLAVLGGQGDVTIHPSSSRPVCWIGAEKLLLKFLYVCGPHGLGLASSVG